MSILMKRVARVAGAAAATALIAACGTDSGTGDTASDPSSSPSGTPSPTETTGPTGLPLCSVIWVDGQDLPVDYKACDQDGVKVKPEKQMCGFGRPMVEHDGRFYAMPGNRINDVGDLATSEQYQNAWDACTG
ncbi:hypothetical protein DDE18_07255 [Nocardioides gansuensis]|uniref:Uncharacterized protein n=1 Tax=Nocardioides gansuensis TaxID=2138300 RepID=A0A2T8FBN6_9ACTN|nr:hypothetical protein [Nocardioides gansuensis]PVG83116.1 hypothetical protein DDE18_07255 [Nocardioides gansuensis]